MRYIHVSRLQLVITIRRRDCTSDEQWDEGETEKDWKQLYWSTAACERAHTGVAKEQRRETSGTNVCFRKNGGDNDDDGNDDFYNWQPPCKWMVCSVLLLIIRSPWTRLKQVHLRKLFAVTSNSDMISFILFILRLTENLRQAELFASETMTCSCIDFSLYNRPWRRGVGKSCGAWKMLNL